MSNKTLYPATATIIPADFWINRPIGYTTDGFPLYPTFAKSSVAPTPKAPTYKPLPVVDVDALADWLIELATDHIEDLFGEVVDVSDILALFDGAVEFDVVDAVSRRLIGKDIERTLASWVPNADLGNAHNLEAFEQSFDHGATDWSGANSDGLPCDLDGAYDPDNAGFFDKFGSSESLGFSECTESFFTHNTTGEEHWG